MPKESLEIDSSFAENNNYHGLASNGGSNVGIIYSGNI